MNLQLKGRSMTSLEQNLIQLFKKYTEEGQIPGIAARIVRKGDTLADVQTGWESLDKKRPLRGDSLFRIYSMSKVMTIVAAMQLYEKGCFTLETPLSDFLPSFSQMDVISGYDQERPLLRPAVRPILMKHLFSMTSGVAYGFNPSTVPADRYLLKQLEESYSDMSALPGSLNTKEMIEILSKTALAFEPGEDYIYGYNHDILGRVIEVITGQSFAACMQEKIFEPLGMKDTTFLPSAEQKERLVPLYRTENTGNVPILVSDDDPMSNFLFKENGFESGGGGLVSSLDDYSRYCSVLLQGGSYKGERIIGRKTLDLMTSNHLSGKSLATFTKDMPGYGYGLGVRVMMNPSLTGIPGSMGEYGWSGAAATWMCIDPMEDLYAVLMLQLLDCPYPLQREFAQVMYGTLN